MEYLIVIYRTILFYIVITLIYRLMGKREIGRLGIVDLIVSILIAELAAMSIDSRNDSVWLAIVPIGLLGLIEVISAYISLKNAKVRNLFDGKVSVIINRGKINFKEMVNQRYSLDDLLSQLREKDIRSIEEVDYAVLEVNGKLSVFKKNGNSYGEYPLPLILDGVIDEDTLHQVQKNKEWVIDTLEKENVSLDDVFYGFFKNKKIYIIKNPK